MSLLGQIRATAAANQSNIALRGSESSLSYENLAEQVSRLSERFRNSGIRSLAIAADNSPEWAIVDLAALEANLTLVPLPAFFTPAQVTYALRTGDVEALITDQPARFKSLAGSGAPQCLDISGNLHWIKLDGSGKNIPAGICKVTFTSGTTGEPKGVMLTWDQIRSVTRSLVSATEMSATDRHLALLPLGVLLENIGGIYVPLLAGASTCLPPLRDVGLTGSSGLEVDTLYRALIEFSASTVILTPQSLQALVGQLEAGWAAPKTLRFAAVGGAPVATRLLERAVAQQLPVFEGYGLSECASVVCLNTSRYTRTGSVGRPLAHVDVRVRDGEVEIRNSGFTGYVGGTKRRRDWWPTGDLGYFDDQGFLHLCGRRRNIFITAFGRNVAPEWVERELTLEAAIAQAAVFGEARPWNVAVVVARDGATTTEIDDAVANANQQLPDYAQVRRWIAATQPFSPANGLLTGTQRPRRESIRRAYEQQLTSLYDENLQP